MTLAIRARRLSKRYALGWFKARTVDALRDLDLDVVEGQILGVLGPNGAGKSTTIKLLLNLIRPTTGEILLFGHTPASTAARVNVGFLPENPAPYEHLTGREFVTLSGQLSGLKRQELISRVDAVIERVGMASSRDLLIRRYSKGMVQRISLAHAIVSNPKLLVLDEPTSGLDVLGRQLVRDIIREQAKAGATVVFCSHIIPDVEALCDTVGLLVGGRLVKTGTVSELLATSSATMELTLEGVDNRTLENLRALKTQTEISGLKVVVVCNESDVPLALQCALSGRARVVQLQRRGSSLEDVFLSTLGNIRQPVGGAIS